MAVLFTTRVPHAREMMGPSPLNNRTAAIAGITGILAFYLPLLAVPLLMGNFATNEAVGKAATRLDIPGPENHARISDHAVRDCGYDPIAAVAAIGTASC